MAKGANNWADQWASPVEKKKENKIGKKIGDVKKLASVGFIKAKAAAVIGAEKVKVGTSKGVKFVKERYKKTKSG